MGFRAAVLILFLLALPVGASNAASQPLCLRCHETHYDSQGTCTDCHRGHPGTMRREIAHDRFVPGRHATFSLTDSAVVKRGATLLLKEGTATPPSLAETPLVIHFEKAGAASENIFAKRCGGCHRALTVKEGGLGEGETAPNLSGLLTPYYPRSLEKPGKEAPWSEQDLEKWLKNPRKLRPLTRMLPIVFKDGEFSQLVQTLDIPPQTPLEAVSPRVSLKA